MRLGPGLPGYVLHAAVGTPPTAPGQHSSCLWVLLPPVPGRKPWLYALLHT